MYNILARYEGTEAIFGEKKICDIDAVRSKKRKLKRWECYGGEKIL
jgi:hypothetical protein